MTHTQWQASLRRSLSAIARDPERALKSLDALVSRIRSEGRKAVGDWHIEQTLEAISIVQSHLEDHRQSAKVMLTLAELHEQQATYHGRAFVSACATAAIELATAGERAAAARLLRRAGPVARTLRPADRLFRSAKKVVDQMATRRARASKRASTE
jgi:hypothetical protein